MLGRQYSSGSYRFGYQGSEKNEEIHSGSYTTEYRQLDTRIGRWLSKDPVVHHFMSPYISMDNNPMFGRDPNGANTIVRKRKKKKKDHITIVYKGVIVDETGKLSKEELEQVQQSIVKQLKESYTGNSENASWSIKVRLRVGKKARGKGSRRESVVHLITNGFNTPNGEQRFGGSTSFGGFDAYVNLNETNGSNTNSFVGNVKTFEQIGKTAAHEIGHNMGLPHFLDSKDPNGALILPNQDAYAIFNSVYRNTLMDNLMIQAAFQHRDGFSSNKIIEAQILHIFKDFTEGKLNRDDITGGDENWGIYPSDKPLFQIQTTKEKPKDNKSSFSDMFGPQSKPKINVVRVR